MQLLDQRNTKRPVVLGIDIGTTNIRCIAYDQSANVLGKAHKKLDVFNPSEDRFEIVPDVLWNSFQRVVNNCLIASHLHANDVSCMGISTQRGTFVTWERETGQPFHNFISWKDRRADSICHELNSSCIIKVLMRLYWILEHYPEIRQRSDRGEVLFGTIDTWLVWKLTDGKIHATDGSNACVTGFFDPFSMNWIGWILRYFKIPKQILPVVKNTCDSFGETLPNIFGSPIPIGCLVGDQQASMFGACCFKEYDVNCTMGSGSFISINTGDKPSKSYYGINPLIGWTIHSKTTYVAECGFHETGPFITWMQNLGFFKNPSDSKTLAQNVADNGGVYFLPGCNLEQFCVTDKVITSKFVGLRSNSSRESIVRAVLETLAFQVCLLLQAVNKLFNENSKTPTLRICGGIASNDFVVQVISTLTKKPVLRLKNNESSSVGAAFLAGLHYGIWKSIEELNDLQVEYDVFYPIDGSKNILVNSFKNWKVLLKEHM